MTFYELYLNDQALFMRTISEQVNWPRVANFLDKSPINPMELITASSAPEIVFAELRIPLLYAIDEHEADTDKETSSQSTDDVLAQSRRQDGKA